MQKETEIYQQIREKFETDSKKSEDLSHKLEKVINDFDNLVNNFYNKNINDKSLSEREKKELKEICSVKLSNIGKEKNNIYLFNDYVLCYFDTCILIRNEMISQKNPRLFYSYMFNLVHFLELVIKNLYMSNVDKFYEVDTTHHILSLYENKKSEILYLGIKDEHYKILIKILKKIQKMVNIDDFAMGFKYPVNKDFKTLIINKKIIDLDKEKLLSIVEEHKLLLFIVLDIYVLGKKSNYDYLIKILIESYNDCQFELSDKK